MSKDTRIETFKTEIKKLPKQLRKRWANILDISKQCTNTYFEDGACCVLGGLLKCKVSNKKFLQQEGLVQTLQKHGVEINGEETFFSAATKLNDYHRVTLKEFATMIRESLHA